MKQTGHKSPKEFAGSSRREFLKRGGKIAAAAALTSAAVPRVHAAEDNTIRLALIGCGGRGSGAVGNALSSPNGPTKLVAMADIVPESKLERVAPGPRASTSPLSMITSTNRRATLRAGKRQPGSERPARTPFYWLRRLSQGDRLPATR